MAIIKAFRGLRPASEVAAQVASPPYDVLNSEEAREQAAGNPLSFLHVTKAEIDLPADADTHSAAVYEKAAENLQSFIKRGILKQDDQPCYYIYQLIMDGRSQTGLVTVSAVSDYFSDVIKKHEYTRPEKEQDRIDHMRTIKAQTGNVFLAYNNVDEIDQLIESWQQQHPATYDFTADDSIRHTLWVVDDADTVAGITRLFKEKVPCTYIADGHHRCASAAKVSKALPDSPHADYLLTTIFPASQLVIMDYNRVIKDLGNYTNASFLSALQDDFHVAQSSDAVKPQQLHEFGMYLDHQWYHLTAREGTYTEDPIGILDVSILAENVLNKLLNIKDQRTDKRIDFVGGIRGLRELEKRVNSGEMKVAFSLYPVSIQQLFDIADNNEVMPPKSTWFEPKLRDGLLTHLL